MDVAAPGPAEPVGAASHGSAVDDAPLLRLTDVTKSFGAVVALRSGSLELRPGSIHALIGENGAGKSTLMKIIAGVETADSGELSCRARE